MKPLLTLPVHEVMRAGLLAGAPWVEVSLDLGRSRSRVVLDDGGWTVDRQRFPWLADCRERTIHYWDGSAFQQAARYASGLVKLVPTEWGPPTFEIDGIKMLPTADVSPWEDAARKVALVRPRGRVVLDTCGGLGYFAAWCLARGATRVLSFEKNPDVMWLRGINPWSPEGGDGDVPGALELRAGDITQEIQALPA